MNLSRYKTFEAYDYGFPLIGYETASLTTDRIATPKNIYGTAFSIGSNCFMTAGHCITAALSECDVIGIAYVATDRYILAEALEYEVVPDVDIGFLKTIATIERAKAFPWETARLPALATVIASGYPFSFDFEQNQIATRGFKGHIVSTRRFARFPAKPMVYELSFASPTGLSGAPLIAIDSGPRIAGVVLGNYETKMLVFSDKELISEEREIIVERYHSLQLGIAIQSTELLRIESKVLGSDDLFSHLNKSQLLMR